MKLTQFLGKNVSELTLGTVQLGLKYGIANKQKKPPIHEAISLLQTASSSGINCFDTAASYGDSEEIIGQYLASNIRKQAKITVISKIPSLKAVPEHQIPQAIEKHVKNTAERFQTNFLDCLLFHDSSDILNESAFKILVELKKKRRLGGIGISVYDPQELFEIVGKYEIDAVQLPFNLFDHRFYDSGLLQKLYSNKIAIFARSIFLQGLFFIPPTEIPSKLSIAKPYLAKIQSLSHEFGLSIAQLAIHFIRSFKEVTSLVIGSENQKQIEQNVEIFHQDVPKDLPTTKILNDFKNIPKEVYDPRTWELS